MSTVFGLKNLENSGVCEPRQAVFREVAVLDQLGLQLDQLARVLRQEFLHLDIDI